MFAIENRYGRTGQIEWANRPIIFSFGGFGWQRRAGLDGIGFAPGEGRRGCMLVWCSRIGCCCLVGCSIQFVLRFIVVYFSVLVTYARVLFFAHFFGTLFACHAVD